METNKHTEESEENTNENANSAYSGSGSMQPGAGTGEAGRLSDYDDDEPQVGSDKKKILRVKASPRPLILQSSRIFNSTRV